ncbi:DMT family transporter [Solirubrobacter pauli]|uniref:DMT family transporter n=1 Tax=Solirubrobacter pauli TaxID=166793 RepID=UPI00319E9353
MIAACAAPGLAIAFWRTGAAAAVLAPVLLARERRIVLPRGRGLWLALAAGLALAAHFGTFIPSLSYTTVASSAALVCTQPIWAGVIGWFLGERLPGRAWAGVGVCLLGVLLMTGVDISVSGDALLGDGLAVTGGVFGGVYIVLGGFARRGLSTLDYTVICYGTCALWLLPVCVLTGTALAGFSGEDWLRIAAITVFGQLVGHSLFNLVLRSISPTMVALGGLFTVPLAAIIAAVALGETPPAAAIPAMALLIAGTALVISARARAAAAS